MARRIGAILIVFLVAGCSRLNVVGGDTEPLPGARDGGPASYSALYEHFRENHRQVSRNVGENVLSVRNAGNRAVQTLDRMMTRLSEGDRAELREVAEDYRTAWDQFDIQSPSLIERRNLKNAGKDVLKRFRGARVNVVEPVPKQETATNRMEPSSTEQASSSASPREEKASDEETGIPAGEGPSGYKKVYNRFREQHRQVFRMIGENVLSVRNSGDRAVKAVERMMTMVTEKDRSRLRKFADDYRRTWKQFDVRTPSLIERKNLKKAGEDVLERFGVEKVEVRSGASTRSETASSSPENDDDASAASVDSGGTKLPQVRASSADDPNTYDSLIRRWRRLHVRFQRGLETSDPMFSTTYEELSRLFDRLTAQVSEEQRATVKHYRRQYELIYQRRNEYMGTRKMNEHLSVMKQKFLSDFTAGTANRENSEQK